MRLLHRIVISAPLWVLPIACAGSAEMRHAAVIPGPPAPVPESAPSRPADGRVTDAERALGVLWKFRAGAPMVGAPVLGARGAAYFGTAEGYVHALGPDGRFEWSYTLNGAVAGDLALGLHGRIHAATRAGTLYALLPDGTLAWKFAAPSAPSTALRITKSGVIVYGAVDGRVYAVSPAGRLLWALGARGALSAGPSVAPWGAVLFAGGTTLTIRESAKAVHTALFDEPLATDPLGWAGDVFVITASGLTVLNREGSRRWTLPGVSFVAPAGGGVVAARGRELCWLGTDGKIERSVALPAEAAAEPCVDFQGTAWLPTDDGQLLRVLRAATVAEALPLARSALLRPVCVGPVPGGRPLASVVVAAEDGTVLALRPAGRSEDLRPNGKLR